MPNAVSVTDINRYIKSLVSFDTNLSHIWIKGEVSNFKVYSSGHAYFSLKDQNSVLKCVMFSSYMKQVDFRPSDGMKVLAYGSINVYERDGVYQLYCEKLVTQGVGDLFFAYNELKAKLEKEGLFLEKYKKPIPFLPKTVGVVTSESGAAVHDIQNVIRRRFPSMNIKIFHVSVQGATASSEISRTLFYISKEKPVDVVILGRGGGSIEELWAFNEEITARAIFNCRVPIISAVGHETDFTISDFVADLRAPTPSAAAELAVPEYNDLMAVIESKAERLRLLPEANLKVKKAQLDRIANNVYFTRPEKIIEDASEKLDNKAQRMASIVSQKMALTGSKLDGAMHRLEAMNPTSVLKRGYSIVYSETGHIVSDSKAVTGGEELKILTGNGEFKALVK